MDAAYEKFKINSEYIIVEYLKSIGHVKAPNTEASKVVVPELRWGTRRNFIDCGVFVMRHMETYAGGSVNRWDCGLVEGRSQKFTLNKLRKKYAIKLLFSDENKQKAKVQFYSGCYATSLNVSGSGALGLNNVVLL
ncbi:uncharacterized protein [Rutidosis leptorrhynchoides]|uniref:uncharacterized protein n=1 Tax=Rutidosis leptorrhynchoides TaxID=125765 RepID=UPI003A99D07A